MSTGSPGHIHHAAEDEARHAWALGNVRIQRMLEQLKALAPFTPEEIKHLQFALIELSLLLEDSTDGRFKSETRSSDEQQQQESWRNTYSDGTPVTALVRTSGGAAEPASSEPANAKNPIPADCEELS